MALIKCPDCGREISDEVEKCPYCRCPIKRGKQAPGEAGDRVTPNEESKKKVGEDLEAFLDSL